MQAFDYHAPQSVPEALGLLRQYGDRARPMAGGTDILLFMEGGKIAPENLVDLSRIPDLTEINYDPAHGLRLGALTTMRDIERSPVIRAHYPALTESTLELAGVQIRNMATIGGNTCNASPAADTIPALMALDAVAVISGADGERRVIYTALFQGPGKTVIGQDELLTAIELPPPAPHSGSHYIKLAIRKAMDIAIVGAGASVTLDGDTVTDCRITLGAVGPTVVRACDAENLLRGNPLDETTLNHVAAAATAIANPISDQRASAGYRKKMVGVLTRQVLLKAADIARRS